MEVVNNFENKLLGRREVTVNLQSEGPTLTRSDVKAQIAKQFKAKEDLVVVNDVNSQYGSLDVCAKAFIYDKKEALEKLTPGHIEKRNNPKVEAKEGEEQAAPATESAPAEQEAEAPVEEAAPAEAPVEEAKEEAAAEEVAEEVSEASMEEKEDDKE